MRAAFRDDLCFRVCADKMVMLASPVDHNLRLHPPKGSHPHSPCLTWRTTEIIPRLPLDITTSITLHQALETVHNFPNRPFVPQTSQATKSKPHSFILLRFNSDFSLPASSRLFISRWPSRLGRVRIPGPRSQSNGAGPLPSNKPEPGPQTP